MIQTKQQPVKQPGRKLKEIIRKSIHISSLVIPIFYRYVIDYNRLLMFIILAVALLGSLVIELVRLQQPSFRKLFHKLFGQVMRRHESRDFTGATFVLFTFMLCVVFLQPIIAFLAMAYLSIGDTFAAIVGISFGKRKFINHNKSIEGSLACFVSILIFSILTGNELSPWIYVAGSVTATLAELWNIRLDDNLKIPLISGLVMTLMSIFI